MSRKVSCVVLIILILVTILFVFTACDNARNAEYYMNKLYDFGYEYVFQFDEEMINDYYLDTGVTANWVVFGANLDIVVIAEMENESSVLMAKRYIEKYFSEAIYYDYTLYSRGNRIYFGKNLLPFLI